MQFNFNQNNLINPDLADSLFCLFYLIVIGIAGLDNSTGKILTPLFLFLSGCLFMCSIHFFKRYLKSKKGE